MKKKQPIANSDPNIPDDVVDLFIRMEAQKGTPDDLRLLMSWASEHPEKLEAFESLNEIWENIGEVEPDEDIIHGPRPTNLLWNEKNAVRFSQAIAAIAASVILAFGIYYYQITNSLVYQTQIGELKKIALVDGSQIHLNGNSEVTVKYIDDSRYLRMDKGEAYFEVAHDKDRAFIVEVGNILVKAVGTAFNIEYIHDNVTVSVVEGTVEIKLSKDLHEATAQKFHTISAHRGDKVKFKKTTVFGVFPNDTKKDEIALVKNENVGGTPLAWRKGVLNLTGEPLHIAVEKINRQSVKQLALTDTRLSNLPIYGSFYIDNVKSFVDAIEVLYPIKHLETKKGYLLSRSDH